MDGTKLNEVRLRYNKYCHLSEPKVSTVFGTVLSWAVSHH